MALNDNAVADPGFPVGGYRPCRGVPTPEVASFQKICMSKRKNLDPWGVRTGGAPWIRQCNATTEYHTAYKIHRH